MIRFSKLPDHVGRPRNFAGQVTRRQLLQFRYTYDYYAIILKRVVRS